MENWAVAEPEVHLTRMPHRPISQLLGLGMLVIVFSIVYIVQVGSNDPTGIISFDGCIVVINKLTPKVETNNNTPETAVKITRDNAV